MNRDKASLVQILERIERIDASGVNRERFLANSWDQDAVIRNLEIIGEAVKRLTAATKARMPDVPWADIAGFRDLAIHSYDKLDLLRTWTLVKKELPALKRLVRAHLAKMD